MCEKDDNRGPVVFAAVGCRQNTWMRGAEEDRGDRASKSVFCVLMQSSSVSTMIAVSNPDFLGEEPPAQLYPTLVKRDCGRRQLLISSWPQSLVNTVGPVRSG